MQRTLYDFFGKKEEIEFTHDITPFRPEMYKMFWEFVVERQYIWYRRFVLKKPYPWTKDPILRQYRFTNVYRELDKCTIYLIDKLTPIKHDRKNILFNVIVFRNFNYYGFFDDIGGLLDVDTYDAYEFIHTLDNLIQNGKKIFNEAYLVHPPTIKKDYRPKEKHVQLAFLFEIIQDRIDEMIDEIDSAETPEDSFNVLLSLPNTQGFMAYEYWTDLTYFGFFRQGWTDNDFVHVGHGAIWGLNLMIAYKDTREKIMPYKEYVGLVYKLRDNMKKALEDLDLLEVWMTIHYKDAFSNVPFLSLRNIEHSLCEFRKYYRLKFLKKGRKRTYTPPKGL